GLNARKGQTTHCLAGGETDTAWTLLRWAWAVAANLCQWWQVMGVPIQRWQEKAAHGSRSTVSRVSCRGKDKSKASSSAFARWQRPSHCQTRACHCHEGRGNESDDFRGSH